MPDTKIGRAETSAYETSVTDYSVDLINTDGATGVSETTWSNKEWSQQLGYYKSIPELMAAIDAKAVWTIGRGVIADAETTFILDKIKGFGKDSFNSILANMIRTYHIGGDAFCEIIRNDQNELINLKPLDPSSMRIVANPEGIIIRYEQISKTKKLALKFKKEEIFHLSRNRLADEIHGVSMITALETLILARNEAIADYKRLLHRNVFPVRIWHLDTDVTAEITAFKAKVAAAKDKFEDIFVPKGAVVPELVGTAPNATLNPLPWINQLNQNFFQATGVPQIIVGSSQELTEASAKISYLAFEQTIEEEQLYNEEQVGHQLGLEIELEFPASLQNEVLSDTGKSETMQAATPEDTTAVKESPPKQKGTQ